MNKLPEFKFEAIKNDWSNFRGFCLLNFSKSTRRRRRGGGFIIMIFKTKKWKFRIKLSSGREGGEEAVSEQSTIYHKQAWVSCCQGCATKEVGQSGSACEVFLSRDYAVKLFAPTGKILKNDLRQSMNLHYDKFSLRAGRSTANGR